MARLAIFGSDRNGEWDDGRDNRHARECLISLKRLETWHPILSFNVA